MAREVADRKRIRQQTIFGANDPFSFLLSHKKELFED